MTKFDQEKAAIFRNYQESNLTKTLERKSKLKGTISTLIQSFPE